MTDKSTGVTRFFGKVTSGLGHPWAMAAAVLLIVAWVPTIIFLPFDTWQLLINTITTIVTFTMVFVIQNTQNRDNRAIQTKLDAIACALDLDSDLLGIEEAPEKVIQKKQDDLRSEQE